MNPFRLPKGRPKFAVPIDATQNACIIMAWIGVAISIAGSYLALQYLPETIPTHFGAAGVPDGHGSKMTILLLPGISLIMNFIFEFVFRLPACYYNYPVTITIENAERQYRLSKTFFSTMRVLTICLLVILNAVTIHATFRQQLNVVVMLGIIFPFVAVIFVGSLLYTVKARRLQ